uniref:Uncharacterized protein n=1 Tax=Ciona intestinalis TaxID=7719 RepID=H2XUW0_CIOIN
MCAFWYKRFITAFNTPNLHNVHRLVGGDVTYLYFPASIIRKLVFRSKIWSYVEGTSIEVYLRYFSNLIHRPNLTKSLLCVDCLPI